MNQAMASKSLLLTYSTVCTCRTPNRWMTRFRDNLKIVNAVITDSSYKALKQTHTSNYRITHNYSLPDYKSNNGNAVNVCSSTPHSLLICFKLFLIYNLFNYIRIRIRIRIRIFIYHPFAIHQKIIATAWVKSLDWLTYTRVKIYTMYTMCRR